MLLLTTRILNKNYLKLRHTVIISLMVLAKLKGAVGRATPNLTGAIKESAVSHNSWIASLMSERNTFLHLLMGWLCPPLL